MPAKRTRVDADEAPSSAAAPPTTYDAKLRHVLHALENLTRSGEIFASGSCSQFPPPGLAFTGTDEHDLQPPLRGEDVATIKLRGMVTQRASRNKPVAWEVDEALLDVRNQHWARFLHTRLQGMFQTLAIASSGVVDIKLKKLLLVEAGGRLAFRREDEPRGDSVFGRLMVVLPGAFEGGDVVVQRTQTAMNGEHDRDDEDMQSSDDEDGLDGRAADDAGDDGTTRVDTDKITWRPGARRNLYDVTYAVCFDNCEYLTERVTKGTALCLLYDLVTRNPSDVPLFIGATRAQQAVNTALATFFEAAPQALAKRFKISSDAWRTINDFAVERHFVYHTDKSHFADLTGVERAVAASLAAFCAQSGGQYSLYLAELMYSEDLGDCTYDTGYDPDEKIEFIVTLKAPWIKYGETEGHDYAPITLPDGFEVAPIGATDDYSEFPYISTSDPDVKRILKRLYHGHIKNVSAFRTFALVVQPTTIELNQSARYPVRTLVSQLRTKLTQSRTDAMQFAQHIIHSNPQWHFENSDMPDFAEFVKILVVINDLQLFNNLLCVVDLEYEDDSGSLRRAVQRFGYDNCLASLAKGVMNAPTLCGRINLILSIHAKPMGSDRLDRLLQALLSLPPWTDATVDTRALLPLRREIFDRLLVVVNKISPQRLADVVAVKDPKLMTLNAGPAALQLLSGRKGDPPQQAMLHRLWELFEPMLPDLKNEPYAKIPIPPHCQQCEDLQAFLSFTVHEATIECPSWEVREHLAQVVKQSNQYEATVSARRIGETALRVDKSRASYTEGIHNDARELERQLGYKLEAITKSSKK